jgi:hypothetical protein
MLPSDQQAGFLNSLKNVRHLLRTDGGTIGFYHESFREFVIAQSKPLDGYVGSVTGCGAARSRRGAS